MQPDAKKFEAWLKSKGVKAGCPACGKRKWSMRDIVAAPLFAQSGSVAGQSFPIVTQTCDNCAFVRSFAGVLMNLV